MSKAPKDAKPDWNSFTKAELIRTIKALDKRQTKLLNELAALQFAEETYRALHDKPDITDCGVVHVKSDFPWEAK